jgi:predicted carbohydrate-binding protein with CBM5 and CBM33 domain
MKLTSLLTMSIGVSSLLLSHLSWGHGYVAYPKARQQICKDDGGYWWPADGSGIANLACRAAYQQSGGYALTQHHEYSSNVTDYFNMTAVKAGVKDGLLCAGGDSRKAGMDIPSPHWQSTIIDLQTTPTLKVRFRATTPHNPSFWQFYLSTSDYDPANAALSWDKLTLIHQQNDVPAESGFYEIDVPLPKSRSGKAVLYTRWQRQDVVGEGFYNCSDLQLVNGDSEPTQWYDKGAYVSSAQLGKVGEKALLRVFDAQGQEQIQHSIDIDASNVGNQAWALELANQINTLHDLTIQIGVLQNGKIQLQNTVAANRIYLSQSSAFVNLDLKAANNGQTCGGLDPTKIFAYPNWPRKDHAGNPSYADKGDLMSDSNQVYRAAWWTQAKPGSDNSWNFVCPLTP